MVRRTAKMKIARYLIPVVAGMSLWVATGMAASSRVLLKKVQPVYPSLAVQTRIEGTVRMQAVVDASGHVKDVVVVSGNAILRQAAVKCVKQWQYEPASGMTLIPIQITFRLNQ